MSEERLCENGNGTCIIHEAEVERRKASNDEVANIKGRIGELLTFKNRSIGFAYGIGVFASLVILGSYSYTYNHMQEATNKYKELEAQTKKVEETTNTLQRDMYDTRVQLARTDERYQALQHQLRSIDSRLEQLLVKIDKEKR
jgi:hypothetical protein